MVDITIEVKVNTNSYYVVFNVCADICNQPTHRLTLYSSFAYFDRILRTIKLYQYTILDIQSMVYNHYNLVNMNAYIKYVKIESISSQDIEWKRNSDVNEGPKSFTNL